jgi:hypothetical protein
MTRREMKPKTMNATGCVHHTIVDDRPGPDGLYHARCCKCGQESRLSGTLPFKNVFRHPYEPTLKRCMAPGTALKLTSRQVILT